MIYKNINGIKVSSLVLGTDSFGTDTDVDTAYDLMDRFCALGGNTLDTARVYGCHFGGKIGDSEQVIGRWLDDRRCRDKVIISTKCAHPDIGSMDKHRLSKSEIEADVDSSLRALKTDYIDILWLHRDDAGLSASSIIDTLDELVRKGKIRCFGTSNWRGERIFEANNYAAMSGKNGFAASQIKWAAAKSAPDFEDDPTLVEMDKTQYDFYKSAKMPVFAYASQAKGFFQKYHSGGEGALSPKARSRYLCGENLVRYKRLLDICERYEISLSAAIVASVTSNTDFDTAAIVGCKSIAQLDDTFGGADCVLDYDDARAILEV